MITLRRGEDRHHLRSRKQKVWFTFNAQDPTGPLDDGFGTLEFLDEYRLSPGADVPYHPPHEAEIITYIRAGALGYEDSVGHSGVIRAGEFQCTTAGRGLRLRQMNASGTDWTHIFQIWLRPWEAEREPHHEQKRFSAAERRGMLCVIASPDGRRDSLRIHQDVLMYSALLDPGQHVVHPLLPGHRAWLHLVEGEVALGDVILTTGDGAGIQAERAVSLTAQEKTEILLLDLGDQPQRPGRIPDPTALLKIGN
ncbi:MAG: pirin family protein [Acidobacteriota bacterium]